MEKTVVSLDVVNKLNKLTQKFTEKLKELGADFNIGIIIKKNDKDDNLCKVIEKHSVKSSSKNDIYLNVSFLLKNLKKKNLSALDPYITLITYEEFKGKEFNYKEMSQFVEKILMQLAVIKRLPVLKEIILEEKPKNLKGVYRLLFDTMLSIKL